MRFRAELISPSESLAYNTVRARAVIKKGLLRAGWYWLKEFLPYHFKVAAYSRYPGVYKRRKMVRGRNYETGERTYSNPAPLYETGNTESMAMGTQQAKAVGRHVTVSFDVPKYLYWIKKHGYDPSAELTAVNDAERKVLVDIIDETVQQEIDKTPVKTTSKRV